MHMTFRESELDRMARSGWMGPAVREMLALRGLPTPVEHLEGIQDDDWWKRAERAVAALREHFATFRFGERTEFGLLLVPSPRKIDTRSHLPSAVRKRRAPASARISWTLRWDKASISPSPWSRGPRSSRSSVPRASRREATRMSGMLSGDVSRFWDTTPATP